MGLRIQALIIGALLALIHSSAFALGLGEIKINSALNQPLEAEIELLQVRELSEREIIVALADNEDFKRLGVERPFFLLDLKFQVDLSSPNGAVARVTSTKPVKEPFLNFIVEAQWPSGRLLREYTVLVDLPVFSGVQQAPVNRATTETSAPAPTTRPSVSSGPQTRTPTNYQTVPERGERPVQPVRNYGFDGDEYGPVRARDNLWEIAQKVRPDSSVSVQQTMLALQRLNPEAFINNNINLLRRGQVLRVPSKDEINAVSPRQAVAQVAQQNRDFSNKTFGASKAQLEGSRNLSSSSGQSGEIEGRVKLSTEDTSPSGSGSGGLSQSEEVQNLKSQLTKSQEQLDATNRENQDLRSRIRAMEEQIETMEKLMEVSNAEMAALEMAAKQLTEAEATESGVEEQVTAPGNEEPAPEVAETQAEPTEEVAAQEEPATAAQQPVTEPEAAKPEPVKPTPAPQPKPKSIVDLIMENILYVGIGAGALLLAIIGFIFMRGRNDGFDDEEFEELAGDFSFDQADAAEDDQSAVDDEGELDTVPQNVDDDYDTEVAEEPEERAVEAETEDVVAECDIHIAYGQYEQAEEKLLRALDREPANGAMRVKLLEVYSAQDDLESFDAQFAKLRVLGDAELMDRANGLRQNFDAAPFDTSAYDVSEFRALVGSDLESTDTQVAYPDEEAIPEDLQLDDDKLDFDFDSVDNLVDSADDQDKTQIMEEPELDLEDSLDFDLDSDSNDDDITQISSLDNQEESIDLLDDSLESASVDENDLSLSLDSGEDIGDLELDLDDGDLDLDLEDVDLDLDLDESLLELDDSDKTASSASEDLDFSLEDGDETLLSDAAAESEFDAQIDREIDGIVSSDTTDEAELGDFLAESSEEPSSDFGEDLALEPEDDKELSAFDDSALSADLAGGDDFSAPEGEDSLELSVDDIESDDLDKLGDFDPGADLGSDVNLDALDQELDALAGGIQGDLTDQGVSADMDEPILDFDEEVEPIVSQTDDQEFDLGEDVDLDLEGDPSFDNVTELDIEDKEDASDLTADDIDLSPSLTEDSIEDQPTAEESSEAAKANITQEFEIPEFDPEEDDDSNLGFLSDSDETATKLDLARAYIDMGDADGAKDILDEIMDEGNDDQKKEAETLLAKLA